MQQAQLKQKQAEENQKFSFIDAPAEKKNEGTRMLLSPTLKCLWFTAILFLVSNQASAAPKIKVKSKVSNPASPKMTLEDQLHNAIIRSYSRSQAQKAIQILDRGANPNAQNGRLFSDAVSMGNEALVRAFLRHGVKITPQALASALAGSPFNDKKTRRMAEILLNHGADPNATTSYQAFSDEPDSQAPPVLYTPLMVAVAEDNFDAAKLLLERGAKVQTRLPNGLTALKVAAQQQKSAFCKLFLNYHADFRGAEENLLGTAIIKNDTAFFDRLKKLGALPHPLQWPSGYYNLSLSMAQRMIAAGASPNLEHNGDQLGCSPLQVATQNRDWPLAQFLLEKGAKIENLVLSDTIPDRRLSPEQFKQQEETLALRAKSPFFDDDEAEVPFFDEEHKEWVEQQKTELAENHREDLRGLQLFLKHGADPNLAYAGPPIPAEATDKRYLTRYTDTPLHVAAANNRKGAINLLIQAGAKLEARNSFGQTPLLTGVEKLSDEAVPVLLDAGANIEARDEEGKTPLITACAYSNGTTYYAPIAMVVEVGDSSSLVQLPLQHGANVQATDSNGGTALLYAAQSGNIAAMRLLLDHGAALEQLTHNGISPLAAAVLSGQVEAARLLLQQGADPDLPAADGHTPRQIASQPFMMEYEVVGEGEPRSEDDKFAKELAEAYSAPIRAGRKQIMALFQAIPITKPK